ncbi:MULTISPECIES: tyrosine-type recombinase/integrase [unclassified Aureimonas]|uniref:tyrosine-type recombinase/integrase n=1 Tax=unclassified Aureimonas TaxID=2615206 RepID=UPI0006F1D5DE|nr:MULTISPECIES: integrase family protein [unclassified Aureimonas]KQT57534.1 hypothetical protein ASG62_09500 [Aureimonas sp. Leaf427]KQT77215.1 hypothetical protein ASG54_13370 [Aureimonas sp. Leaf460]
MGVRSDRKATPDLTQALVDRAIRSTDERYDVSDKRMPGLILRVTPGSATWTVRTKVRGVQKRAVLGPARLVSIRDAREMAQAAKDRLALGHEIDDAWIDGQLVERKIRETAMKPTAIRRGAGATWTWEEAVEAFEGHLRKTRQPKTVVDYLQFLHGKDLTAAMAGRLVTEITPEHVGDVIREVHQSGRERSAQRILSVVSPMWTYLAVEEPKKSGVRANPMKGMPIPRRTNGSERQTRLPAIDECANIVLACRAGILHPAVAAAIELLVYTAQRRLTVVQARVGDIGIVEGERCWIIPGDAMKGGREHVIPLVGRTVEIADARIDATREEGAAYLFPQVRPRRIGDTVSHVSEFTLTARLVDLPGSRATPHDLRRAFTTAINGRSKAETRQPELVLDHLEGRQTVTDLHYDRAQYLAEKSDMLAFWGAKLDEAVERMRSSFDADAVRKGLSEAMAKRNAKQTPGRKRDGKKARPKRVTAGPS